MKKYFSLIVALMAMLFAGSSFAFTPPPAPQSGWYVVDQTGKLSEEQKVALNQKIDQVSKATKNEFGILLLNTMDGDSIEDVAYTTFNTWGIGKRGLDNGVLIVVSLAERKSRIETGKGVGGEVTDLQSKQILDNTLRPFLKKGDFAGGFNATLDALGSLIESRHNKNALVVTSPTPSSSAGCSLAAAGVGTTDDGSGIAFLVFLLVVSGFALVALMRRSARRKQEIIDEEARIDAARLADAEELQRQHRKELERIRLAANVPMVPHVQAPVERRTILPPPVPRRTVTKTDNTTAAVAVGVAVGAAASILAAEERARLASQEEENRRRRNERDEEDRRRRQREDDDRRSSSSSDYGFGSSSGGFDSGSGGGFDGGSSGGGGSSSDW